MQDARFKTLKGMGALGAYDRHQAGMGERRLASCACTPIQRRSFHCKTPAKAVFIGHECYAYAHWQSYIAARKLFTPLN
jgi:hypothetical protein